MPSIFTPNFSTDPLGKHTHYIQQLSSKHASLSKLVLDEHYSESLSTQADEDRILALRASVQNAWSKADGNPASGKWIVLSRLLRMGVTAGRRGKWTGARSDLKPPDGPDDSSGWLSTMSESEWKEWERKYIQAQNLKNRVEIWKKGVEVPPESPPPVVKADVPPKDSHRRGKSRPGVFSDKESTKSVPATSMDPLRDSAPFGFGVVKRSSQTNVLNGKPPTSGNLLSEQANLLPISESLKEPPKTSSSRPKERNPVELLPAMCLSFSGPELVTSTPKQVAKPSPVTRSEVSSLTPLTSSPIKRALLGRPSSSSLASPPGKRRAGHPLTSKAPSAILESSQRHPISHLAKTYAHDSININNKRTLDVLHSYPDAERDGRKSKKAKSISSADVAEIPRLQAQDHPAVPTLTELLASAKKGKKKRPSVGKPQLHLFASKPRSEDNREVLSVEDDVPYDKTLETPTKSRQEYDFYSHIDDFDMDVLSPVKSLSAIADAPDDEEEGLGQPAISGQFVLDSSFHPLATSTQMQDGHHPSASKSDANQFVITQPDNLPRPRGNADSWESIYAPPRRDDDLPLPALTSSKSKDSLFPQLSYDLQFESAVAAQVEKVNKLLQRDVGYVNREREDEDEDDAENSSFEGGNSRRGSAKEGYGFGYGKAFEYDQSL